MWQEPGQTLHGTRSAAKSTNVILTIYFIILLFYYIIVSYIPFFKINNIHSLKQSVRYGRDAFKQAILQRLIPALRAFSPDLILLSTGNCQVLYFII